MSTTHSTTKQSYQHLSEAERGKIEVYLSEGLSSRIFCGICPQSLSAGKESELLLEARAGFRGFSNRVHRSNEGETEDS